MSDSHSLKHRWDKAKFVAEDATELVAEDAQARVFLLPSYDKSLVPVHSLDKVGAVAFLVQLRPESLPPHTKPYPHDDAWNRQAKVRIRAAMRMVSPELAGFPEWRRIYADDAYICRSWVVDGIPGGVCVITTYRRRLHQAMHEARRPLNFSKRVRKDLLKQAKGRCLRCGSSERLEVDHIVPIGLGGDNDPGNGWVLCHDCHLTKTRAERKFGLNHEGHREHGLSWEAAQQRRFTPETFLVALRERTGWSIQITLEGSLLQS